MSEESVETIPSAPVPKKRPNPILLAVLGLIVVGGAYKGYTSIMFSRAHAVTEDAYVTGDLMNISPTVSGTLVELDVLDGQFVHKGDKIAKLDTSGPEADLAQAEANWKAMQTQVPEAQAAFEFAKLSTDAAIKGSEAGVEAQAARTAGSRLQIDLTRDTVKNQIQEASSQLATAKAQAAQAHAGVEAARAAVMSAQQSVVTAQRQADAAKGGVTAAEANSQKARKDLNRFAKLVETEAITRQQFDAATAASTALDAALLTAQEQEKVALSQINQARRAVAQSRAQLVVTQKQADAADSQVQVASAALKLAQSSQTSVAISGTNAQSSQGMTDQATAGVSSAEAGVQQVALREKQIATAKAQVDQSKAAMDRAKIHLRDCVLLAPCDGYVVKRLVNVGTTINPGQTVATITRGAEVWVIANFKETEIGNVREGQPVDFEVDAYPASNFRGKVIHVLRATGSATTLLPPDNSTGNFTKVVQRIPIKISIEPVSALDYDILRQGMSVTAIIDTSKSETK
jgi:membrane fusion protein (multidrug efflux system)